MTWNYRVVHRRWLLYNTAGVDEMEDEYAIHEVYYDDDGNPDGCTVDAIAPVSESVDGLKDTLARMTNALYEPVLEYDQFGGEMEEE